MLNKCNPSKFTEIIIMCSYTKNFYLFNSFSFSIYSALYSILALAFKQKPPSAHSTELSMSDFIKLIFGWVTTKGRGN